MGLLLTRLFNLFEAFGPQGAPSRIVMLGLDAAGKTTILYKLKLNETPMTIPTIGFNVETVSPSKGVSFTVWDIGGQKKIRDLWRHYYVNSNGIVFVVDSSDVNRLSEVTEQLWDVLEADELRGVPLEVIANKQDLTNSVKPSEIADRLKLNHLSGRKWHIQGTNATSGEGVYEAMESLSNMIKETQRHPK